MLGKYKCFNFAISKRIKLKILSKPLGKKYPNKQDMDL